MAYEPQKKAVKSGLQKIADSLAERKRIVDAGLAKGQEKNADEIYALRLRVQQAEIKAMASKSKDKFYRDILGESTNNGGTIRARDAHEQAKSDESIAAYGRQVLDPAYREKYGDMEKRLQKVQGRSDKIGKELEGVQESIKRTEAYQSSWTKKKQSDQNGQK